MKAGLLVQLRITQNISFRMPKKNSTLPSKIGPLLDENNLYTGSSQTMSDILSRQYEKVFSVPSSSCPNTKPRSDRILGEIVFSMEDLIAAIDELSNNAGSGPDGLPAILLKKMQKPTLRTTLFALAELS